MQHQLRARSPLHDLDWNAPRSGTFEERVGDHAKNYVHRYATDGDAAFMQRINLTDRQVFVGEAPLDKSVPRPGPGFRLATLGTYRDDRDYQETARTRAFGHEVWQEYFG